ncbi:SSI family serine proteinase inhibitor [Nonomuraea cavernae]|uniref:SSI family serine proteinase inhibitor n=1 Tax=Nonomuraea cavernae TaxID=2045107 RepID=UPI001664357D|nr:SSI family serine proteinase inhibitor [Nonomuraea cavernae]MCA2187706.1 subtilase-type protease inhibitor [Nonomuraea cavernae]
MNRLLLTAAISIPALGAAGAASALASTPVSAGHHARSVLTITVTDSSGKSKAYRLTCDRDGGNHPNATAACDALRSVNGQISKLSRPDAICTREYSPTKVSVKGTWRGANVSFSGSYPNSCLARAAVGAVYPERPR